MVSKENLLKAEEFKVTMKINIYSEKEKGNFELRNKNSKAAIFFYSEAIKLNSTNPVYFSNRSAAFYNLCDFEKSLADANETIKLDSSYLKVSSNQNISSL